MSIFIVSSCTQDERVREMPLTTDSKLALEFYETGLLAFDQIKFSLAYHNLELAVKEDPDFFMAHFWMYFMSGKGTKKVADKAVQTNAPLNEAEQQIKSAFKYLLDGQENKVVEHLEMAIDLYPGDPHVHKILYILQFQYMNDLDAAVESMERAIEACPDYPAAYNQLGYVLMDLERFDEAESAFDRYISLAPAIANPYDSKGDFYMNTGQYKKAYESYSRAYEIDPYFTISEKKARKAKQLIEETEET